MKRRKQRRLHLASILLAQQMHDREKLRYLLRSLNEKIERYNERTKQRISRADRAMLFGTAERFSFVNRIMVEEFMTTGYLTAVTKR